MVHKQGLAWAHNGTMHLHHDTSFDFGELSLFLYPTPLCGSMRGPDRQTSAQGYVRVRALTPTTTVGNEWRALI